MRIAACVVGLLAVVTCVSQPQYEVVDLTALYGQGFQAVSINDSGVIGGNYFGRACTAYDGKLTMLPKWKGEDWRLQDFGNNGDALGWSRNAGAGVPSVYYNAAKGTVVDMGIPGAPANGAVRGINSVGQGTGQLIQGMPGSAFVWEQGAPLQILEPGGIGFDLNDSGTVAGFGGVGRSAALWVDGVYQNLHPAWASESEAVAVNELDEAVGYGWAPGVGFHALLWRDGQVIDLGNLGQQHARSLDINDDSQIVGFSTNSQGIVEGFMWEDGTMYALEDLVEGGTGFVVINAATSISSSGQILASGFTGSLNNSLQFNPVPEPSTILTLGSLCLFLCGRKVCRNRRHGGENENPETECGDYRLRIDP